MRSLLALAFALSAFQPDADNPDQPGGRGGDSCAEVFACSVDCQTDSCADACYEDGSSSAQDLINEIGACIERNGCEDTACVDQKCGSQLDQCFDATGGPSGSMLPATIVGDWTTSDATSNITFTFTSTGRVSKVAGLFTGSGSCESSFVISYEGVVELTANELHITVLDGSFTSFGCDGTTPTNSGPHEDPEDFRFTTGVDGAGELLQLENLETGNTVTYHRG